MFYADGLITRMKDKMVADLIKPIYLNHIIPLIRELPRVRMGCIECRLEESNDRIDFQICPFVANGEMGEIQQYFIDRSNTSEESRTIWDAYQAISNILLDKESFANAAIPNIWLVYDIVDLAEHQKTPWLYVGFLDNPLSNEINFNLAQQILLKYELVDHKMFDKEMMRIHTITPSDAYLCALGLMQARDSQYIRLAFKFQQMDALYYFLEKMHWKGDIEQVIMPYASMFESGQTISLAFDLGESIQMKIGIECAFGENTPQKKIRQYIENLVDLNICSSRKRDAMLKWHNLPKTADSSQINTWINHFKYVFDASGLKQTKGYLFYQY